MSAKAKSLRRVAAAEERYSSDFFHASTWACFIAGLVDGVERGW